MSKKTIYQLTAMDKIYSVEKNKMEIREHFVDSVEREVLKTNGDKLHRTDKTSVEKIGDYHRHTFYFSHKPDAIRYASAQMMKVLYAKIESAKRAVQEIKDFREENHQLLNHDWTSRKIAELEQASNQ